MHIYYMSKIFGFGYWIEEITRKGRKVIKSNELGKIPDCNGVNSTCFFIPFPFANSI